MRKIPEIPRLGSAYALTRFFMRMAVFAAFAAFGHQGFGKALGGMLILAALYCIVVAAVRREEPFGPDLTHVDEAAAYAAIAVLAATVS